MISILKKLYLFIMFGKITEMVVDRMEGLPCEIAYYDRNGEMIGYWAFGSFDPSGKYRG